MTSPKTGSVTTLQVVDAEGNASMRRTILLTSSAQGLIAWQHKKKWLRSDQVSVVCTQSILGQWGSKDDLRAVFSSGYGMNSDPVKGLKSEFKTTAAAVIHIVNEGTPEIEIDGELCRLTWGVGEFEFNRENGAIRNISANRDGANLEVTTGTGLVEAELSRLMDDTKDWPNQCQPGREWPALAAIVLEDVRTVDMENSDVSNAVVLLLDLLSNEAAVKHLSQALAQFSDRHVFYVPQENTKNKGNVSGWIGLAPMMVNFIPVGSFPHRLGMTWFDAANTGNPELYSRLMQNFMSERQEGAIYCDMMARLYPASVLGSELAKAGLDRLSTEQFQRDVAPFFGEPGAIHDVLYAFVVWLQNATDEDTEKLATLTAKHMNDENGQQIDIRPVLAVIRRQRDKSAEEVLASLVPVIWEGGLQAWVETDLRVQASMAPKDSKKYFSTPEWDLFKTISTKTSPKNKAKAAPVKPASQSGSIKDINLDEQWDLGE